MGGPMVTKMKCTTTFDCPDYSSCERGRCMATTADCIAEREVSLTTHERRLNKEANGQITFSSSKTDKDIWFILPVGNGKEGKVEIFSQGYRGDKLIQQTNGSIGVTAHDDETDQSIWTLTDVGDGNVFITSYQNQQLVTVSGDVGFSNSMTDNEAWTIEDSKGINLEAPPCKACSSIGHDRFKPVTIGCCSGLTECEEPRPILDDEFCEPNNGDHGIHCFSTRIMCRKECRPSPPPIFSHVAELAWDKEIYPTGWHCFMQDTDVGAKKIPTGQNSYTISMD